MIEVSEEEVLNYCCGNGNSSLKDKYISFEKQNDRVQNEIKITISNFAMIKEGKTPNISENTTQGNMVEYPQGWRAPLLGPTMCASLTER